MIDVKALAPAAWAQGERARPTARRCRVEPAGRGVQWLCAMFTRAPRRDRTQFARRVATPWKRESRVEPLQCMRRYPRVFRDRRPSTYAWAGMSRRDGGSAANLSSRRSAAPAATADSYDGGKSLASSCRWLCRPDCADCVYCSSPHSSTRSPYPRPYVNWSTGISALGGTSVAHDMAS